MKHDYTEPALPGRLSCRRGQLSSPGSAGAPGVFRRRYMMLPNSIKSDMQLILAG